MKRKCEQAYQCQREKSAYNQMPIYGECLAILVKMPRPTKKNSGEATNDQRARIRAKTDIIIGNLIRYYQMLANKANREKLLLQSSKQYYAALPDYRELRSLLLNQYKQKKQSISVEMRKTYIDVGQVVLKNQQSKSINHSPLYNQLLLNLFVGYSKFHDLIKNKFAEKIKEKKKTLENVQKRTNEICKSSAFYVTEFNRHNLEISQLAFYHSVLYKFAGPFSTFLYIENCHPSQIIKESPGGIAYINAYPLIFNDHTCNFIQGMPKVIGDERMSSTEEQCSNYSFTINEKSGGAVIDSPINIKRKFNISSLKSYSFSMILEKHLIPMHDNSPIEFMFLMNKFIMECILLKKAPKEYRELSFMLLSLQNDLNFFNTFLSNLAAFLANYLMSSVDISLRKCESVNGKLPMQMVSFKEHCSINELPNFTEKIIFNSNEACYHLSIRCSDKEEPVKVNCFFMIFESAKNLNLIKEMHINAVINYPKKPTICPPQPLDVLKSMHPTFIILHFNNKGYHKVMSAHLTEALAAMNRFKEPSRNHFTQYISENLSAAHSNDMAIKIFNKEMNKDRPRTIGKFIDNCKL